MQSTFDYVVVKNAVVCKSGDKTPENCKKMTESGGKTSKFGQNLVEVTGLGVCYAYCPLVDPMLCIRYPTARSLLKTVHLTVFLRCRPSQVLALHTKENSKPNLTVEFGILVEVTGLEPAASSSQN